MFALYILFSLLITVGLPVVIIVVIIRVVNGRSAPKRAADGSLISMPVNQLTPRQLAIGFLAVTAGYAGLSSLYVAPEWLLHFTDQGSIFGAHLVLGLVVLSAGVAARRQKLAGGLLMIIGVLTTLTAMGYVFENLGSVGILAIVFLVLVALIGLTVHLTHREKRA